MCPVENQDLIWDYPLTRPSNGIQTRPLLIIGLLSPGKFPEFVTKLRRVNIQQERPEYCYRLSLSPLECPPYREDGGHSCKSVQAGLG
jgi:hypothetical protein